MPLSPTDKVLKHGHKVYIGAKCICAGQKINPDHFVAHLPPDKKEEAIKKLSGKICSKAEFDKKQKSMEATAAKPKKVEAPEKASTPAASSTAKSQTNSGGSGG